MSTNSNIKEAEDKFYLAFAKQRGVKNIKILDNMNKFSKTLNTLTERYPAAFEDWFASIYKR
jgi:hypothetical protein